MVQWLRLCTFTAGGLSLIRGWGTKIPQAVKCSQKKKKTSFLLHLQYVLLFTLPPQKNPHIIIPKPHL